MIKERKKIAYIAQQFLTVSNKNLSYKATTYILQNVNFEDPDSIDLVKKIALQARELWPNKPVLSLNDIKKLLDLFSSPSSSLVNKNNIAFHPTNNNYRKIDRATHRNKNLITLFDFMDKEKQKKIDDKLNREKLSEASSDSETHVLSKKINEKEIGFEKIRKKDVGIISKEIREVKKSQIEMKVDTRKNEGILEAEESLKTPKQTLAISKRVKIDVIKTIDQFQAKESYESFNKMFVYRFRKLKNILISKGLKNVISSNELKNVKSGEEHHIIIMVYEKRITKGGKGGLIIGEDEEGFVTIYVPFNGDLAQKFNRVLLDTVIGIRFRKVSGGMVLCEDIIFAGPNRAKKRNQPNEPMKIVFISDLHVGSKQFLRKHFENFIRFINGEIDKPWVKKLSSGIKFIGIVGDLVDGVGVYPNQREELEVDIIYQQFDELYVYLSRINDEIEIVAIPGNHDPAGKFVPQPPVPNEFLGKLSELPNFHMFGNPSLVSIDGVKILLYHGQGLEDIASAMSMSILEPTRIMVEEIRNLHILPLWGYKSIVPLEYDPLLIEELPDIYITGHLHRVDARITTLGSSLLINSSTFQGITSWQIKMGIEPTPGIFPVVDLPSYDVYFIRCDDKTCELLNRQ